MTQGHWLRLLQRQLDEALVASTTPDTVTLIIPRYCVEQLAALEYAHIPGLPTSLVDLDGIEEGARWVTGDPTSPQVFEHDDDVRMAHQLAHMMIAQGPQARAKPLEVPLDFGTGQGDHATRVAQLMAEIEAGYALSEEIDLARTYLAKLGAQAVCDNWPDPTVTRIIRSVTHEDL